MKRLIRHLGVLVLLVPGFVLASSPALAVVPAQTSTDTSRDVIRKLYAAYNAGDWTTLTGLITADAIDHDATPGQAPGRAGIIQALQEFHTAFTGDVVIEDLVAAGDKVADRIRLDGRQTGAFFGVPATGKPVHIEAIEIWKIADGQITEGWHVENILQLLIQLGAVPSPGGPSTATPSTLTTLPSSSASPVANPDLAANEDVVRRYYAAVNDGALDLFDTLLAPDAVDHNPASLNQPPGREGIRQEITALLKAFPDYHVTNQDIFAEGDLVVVRSIATGTQNGPLGVIAPTGKPVQFEAMDIWRVEHGEIVEVWHIEQLLNVLIQIGAVPSPGGPATPAVASPSA